MLQTRNWRESGQANLLKRLMAIHCPLSSFPLYTTLGAFSPCSDTMFSEENPFVAAFSCSKLNSPKLGHNFLSPFSPFSATKTNFLKEARVSRQNKNKEQHKPWSEDSRTEGLRWEWNQQKENLEQRAPM